MGINIILGLILLIVLICFLVLGFKSGSGLTVILAVVVFIILDSIMGLFGKHITAPSFITQEIDKRFKKE